MCKRETLDIREPKMKNRILRRRQVCETTSCCDPTQSRKRKRGTKKILTFDQMSLVFFRVSHSHFRMNKKFFFSFFFSLRKMYFSDAPKDALSQTLCRHSPRKKRSSSITPSFSPPFDSFMHQLLYSILPFVFICLLHNTQHTQTSSAQ